MLNDLRATARAWFSFTAVAEADSEFSRKYPERHILSDWTKHDDAMTDDPALQFIDDSIVSKRESTPKDKLHSHDPVTVHNLNEVFCNSGKSCDVVDDSLLDKYYSV